MEKPQMCFLQETKCNSTTLERILAKAWPRCRSVAIDASGASGGLAIAWNSQAVSLSDFHASHHLIQASFHLLGTNVHGNLSNVYFPQESGSKCALLNTIELLNRTRYYPLWIIGGDFNMITRLEEKTGGRTRLEPETESFKDFISSASLIDLPFCNGTFTWSNRRGGKHQISSKLDRFLISDNAVHTGGDFTSEILAHSGSDHWPIALQWQRPGDTTRRPFRFEAFWLTHPAFKDFVKTTWASFIPPEGSKMYQLQQKLWFLKSHLKRWNRETFGNIFEEQQKLNNELKELHQKIITTGHTDATLEQERHLSDQLENRRKQEEIYWRQKSRNQQGARVEEHKEIEQILLNHFQQVHREPAGDRQREIEKITSNIPKLVTAEQNELLMRPVQPQEVDEAMAQLKEGKSPGPDGFTTTFFHAFWDMIKKEVWEIVEESRAKRWILPSLNSTFIALIPKEENSMTPDKFRPIALCNVIYKVISKVAANRLKPLLPMLISPEQSGYVEGRQILDGIILSNEIIHSLKHSKQAGMLLKLDLSKAFDKLSWSYIHQMLIAFGFCSSWVRWIMSLITSSHLSILVNGFPSRPFKPSRGIRQGDPLSPFLFVIMAEGLGRHIKQALLSQRLKGISLYHTPASSHQQFVDDTMLFGYPSVQEAYHLKSLLSDFSEASGTHVNSSKSQIFFFHTPPVVKSAITRILGFRTASLPSSYLGAPLAASALKQPAWRILLEKLESKLSLWTLRSLNMASRVVLIKSVLQAMPLYLFSILAAPKWVLKRLRNMQRDFLWGSSETNRKWALVKWDNVCKPKTQGGIGLRDPETNNTIMNAKIWWQWVTTQDKMWARLWRAKYANNRPQEELIRFTPMDKGSLIWNAAKQHYQLIQKHSFWEIRNGCTARFWNDAWNQMPSLSSVFPPEANPIRQDQQQATVHQFWTQETENGFRQWLPGNQITSNVIMAGRDELENELKKRSIRHQEGADILRWGYAPKGSYSTSEAYHLMGDFPNRPDPIWGRIWSFKVWPKVTLFLWMVGNKKILTWDRLRRRNFQGPSICHNCFQDEETQQHLLDTCPLANLIWEKISFRCQRRCKVNIDIIDTIRQWPKTPYNCAILNHLWNIIPGLTLWNLWKERNQRIFKNQTSPIEIIWNRLKDNLRETMLLHQWTKEDLPTADNEKNILDNWGLSITQETTSTQKIKRNIRDNCRWTPPPINAYKLNFDGASKGNPGQAGFGGIIRDSKGSPVQIYFGNIGWDTNNAAELEGLWQGLSIARELNLYPLIVEGDSQIIINMATHIQNGSHTRKVAHSWRLEARLNNIDREMHQHRALSFLHTRREGNKTADLLANLGVECSRTLLTGNLDIIPNPQKAQECRSLIQSDVEFPDAGGGTSQANETHALHVMTRAIDSG
eukprot:PITA_02560